MWLRGRNGAIRWYDPITGRWLSKDPIGITAGLNRYVFCHNDPVNFVDPFGFEESGSAQSSAGSRVLGGINTGGGGSFHGLFGFGGKGSASTSILMDEQGVFHFVGVRERGFGVSRPISVTGSLFINYVLPLRRGLTLNDYMQAGDSWSGTYKAAFLSYTSGGTSCAGNNEWLEAGWNIKSYGFPEGGYTYVETTGMGSTRALAEIGWWWGEGHFGVIVGNWIVPLKR